MLLTHWLPQMLRGMTDSRRSKRTLARDLGRLECLEARLVLSTVQDFDALGTGTSFNRLQVNNPPAPIEIDGGPTGVGQFLRLVHAPVAPFVAPNVNTITFPVSDAGTFNQVVADFDFRITPGVGRADGFVYALLNTATYFTPNVEPQAAAEEANYVGSLGIGFDIFQNDDLNDIGNDIIRANFSNSISVHFNSTVLTQVDVSPFFDLANGQWFHAKIVMRPGGGLSDVSVILTPSGGQSVTVVDQFVVAGLAPYQGRVHFAARAGGESANFDLDNINTQFSAVSQTFLSLEAVSYVAAETQASVQVTVSRTGGSGDPVSVTYSTANGSATAGSDYVSIAPTTLSFGAGELSKTFTVNLLNDADTEDDEAFLVSLSNPVGAVIGGTTTAGITLFDDESARLEGQWSNPEIWPIVAIHTHVLPTGRVLFWDRFGETRLWDPVTDTFSIPAQPGFNVFCSGHSFLADGSLLVTGGHHHGGDPIDDQIGMPDAATYNALTDEWTTLPEMAAGRWYPTTTTLPNGDALVISGTITDEVLNTIAEIWQPDSGTFRQITGASEPQPLGLDLYPKMFVLPDGRLFKAGSDQDTWFLDTEGDGAWTPGPARNFGLRAYGAAIMYEPGKIMVVGGGRVDKNDLNPDDDALASAEVIDFTLPHPADRVWRTVAPMQFDRRQLNATLLPDGKILVTGGVGGTGFNSETNPALAAEVWDPQTELWTTLSSAQVPRGYHSTAILLPDGRVMTGGGGEGAGATGQHNDAEIFSPAYLFEGPRPTISTAPTLVDYGQSFFVGTPNAADISKVSLIRLPSTTHSFDFNQRFNNLSFTRVDGGLSVAAPAGATLAPPGHYMLFILNDDGVPAVANIVQITDHEAAPITAAVAAGTLFINDSLGIATDVRVTRDNGTSEFVVTSFTGGVPTTTFRFAAASITNGIVANLGPQADRFDASGVSLRTTIHGGAGNDSIIGSAGNDSVFGDAGNDTMLLNNGDDIAFGGDGNDVLRGGAGRDLLVGDSGNDSLFGQGSVDTLDGGAGIDVLDGGVSGSSIIDQVEGTITLMNTGFATTRGDRVIAESIGYATLSGGSGADFFNTNGFNSGLVTVLGGDGNDTLNGGATNEVFLGEGGDDVLQAGGGRDNVSGGAGNDTVRGQGGIDVLSGGTGNDRIDAGNEANQLREDVDANFSISTNPATGAVTLSGLGTDTVLGMFGTAYLVGGDSNNVLDVSNFAGVATLFGGAGNDELRGGPNADRLFGGLGNDTLRGNAGNDVVFGEAGDDVLSGGEGTDRVDGGTGEDNFYEKAVTSLAATVTVIGLRVESTVSGTETVAGIERIVLVGGSNNDRFDASASSVPVVLLGRLGNDTLLGSPMPDTLDGGGRGISDASSGTDSLVGNSGADTYDDDPADSRVQEAGDTIIADVLMLLPSWIDSV